ncbi:MAG: hypothetical protein LAQ69_39190 [Acidobacteriia bacterium]|nr:hypothetical protein [Terriglobia bacterium]
MEWLHAVGYRIQWSIESKRLKLMGMRSIILTCATALTCLTMVAQTTKKAARPLPKETRPVPKEARPGKAYSNTDFDPTLAHLPAAFNGHDIQRLSSELEKAKSTEEKKEFESTEQWNERLRLAEAQPVFGNLTRKSTYAFVVERYTTFTDSEDETAKGFGATAEISETFDALMSTAEEAAAAGRISHRSAAEQVQGYGQDWKEQYGRASKTYRAQLLVHKNLIGTSDPVTSEEKRQRADAIRAFEERTDSPATAVNVAYDADRTRFDITIQADVPPCSGGSTLRILSGPASHRAYTGSNGFGAAQNVNEYGFKEYKLLIANGVAVPFVAALAPKRIHVEVPIAPEKAKEVKPQIQVIAICKLTAPFTSSGRVRQEATRDAPTSVDIDLKYVKVKILGIWIYNYDTGEVYARIQPADEVR